MTARSRTAESRLGRYIDGSDFTKAPWRSFDPLLAPVLDEFLQKSPDSSSGRVEMLSLAMDALDTRITEDGPMDRQTRSELRSGAKIVLSASGIFRAGGERVSDYRLLEVRAHELLRDVPFEAPLNPVTTSEFLSHAEAAVAYFLNWKDRANLVRSVFSLGNIYRIIGQERKAKTMFGYASHILNERCDRRMPRLAILFHEALTWKLRNIGDALERKILDDYIKELTELAERAADPRRWVVHFRDLAGFAGFSTDEPFSIHEASRDLTTKRGELVHHTAFGDPTLITPFVEFNIANGHRDEAIRIIEEEYVPAYRIVPNYYNHRKILRWCKKLGFVPTVPVPNPKHDGGYLSFLPRYLPSSI